MLPQGHASAFPLAQENQPMSAPLPGMTYNNPVAGPTDATLQLLLATMSDGKQQVIALMHTPAGTMKADLSPDDAEEWAAMLSQAASQARSGLIIASAGQLGAVAGNGRVIK